MKPKLPSSLTAAERAAILSRLTDQQHANSIGVTRQCVTNIRRSARAKIADAAEFGNLSNRAKRFVRAAGGRDKVAAMICDGSVFDKCGYGVTTHKEICAWLNVPFAWLRSAGDYRAPRKCAMWQRFSDAIRSGAKRITATMADGSKRSLYVAEGVKP